jgi:hypothetical protein
MVLSNEGRRGEVAQVESFHLFGPAGRVGESLFAGSHGERAQAPFGKCPERRFAGAGNRYSSHIH